MKAATRAMSSEVHDNTILHSAAATILDGCHLHLSQSGSPWIAATCICHKVVFLGYSAPQNQRNCDSQVAALVLPSTVAAQPGFVGAMSAKLYSIWWPVHVVVGQLLLACECTCRMSCQGNKDINRSLTGCSNVHKITKSKEDSPYTDLRPCLSALLVSTHLTKNLCCSCKGWAIFEASGEIGPYRFVQLHYVPSLTIYCNN